MNNIIFPIKKFVKVNVSDIIWDCDEDYEETCLDWGLPPNVQDYEVEVDEDVDPFEQWREDGGQTGYEALCEALTDQLSDEYGFCIISIDNVEVIG